MAFQGDSIFWVELEKIVPNPYQPRREFDEEKLKELSESIRMYGVLQPLTVSRKEQGREDGTFFTEYELIAGERRLRASRLAGLAQVPVIIREGEDSEQEKLELAIIENLQREDLNAVDRAMAFKQLADTFGLSHAQVAKKVGRSREYVSNSIRILNLPDYILDALRRADLSEGHARTLLMLSDKPEELDTVFREILLKKLSVREVERIARKIAVDKVRKKEWKGTDPELMEIEKQFNEALGTRVSIMKTDYGGKLTIDYFSQDDLEAMLKRLQEDRANAAVAAEGSAMAELANATALEATPQKAEDDSTKADVAAAYEEQPVVSERALAETTGDPDDPGEEPEEAAHEPVHPTESQPEEAPAPPVPQPDPHSMAPEEPKYPAPTPDPPAPAAGPSAPAEEPASPEPTAPTPEAPPTEDEKKTSKQTDESDLYSIRNFSI